MNYAIIAIAMMYAALAAYSVYWMFFNKTEAFFTRKKQQ